MSDNNIGTSTSHNFKKAELMAPHQFPVYSNNENHSSVPQSRNE